MKLHAIHFVCSLGELLNDPVRVGPSWVVFVDLKFPSIGVEVSMDDQQAAKCALKYSLD